MSGIAVTIQDASGNTVAAATAPITVALTNAAAGATLSGTTTVLAQDGVATFTDLSIQKADTGYTLVATSGELESATSAPFNVTGAPAIRIELVGQPTTVTAGAPMQPPIEVALFDEFDNRTDALAPAVSLSLTTNPGGSTLSGTTERLPMGGVAAFTDVSLNKAASGYVITATSLGIGTVMTAPFTVQPAAAAKLTMTGPTGTAEGAAILQPAPAATVRDAFDNVLTTATNPVTVGIVSSNGATLSGTLTVNAVAGIATFPDLSIDLPGSYQLRATSPGLSLGSTTPFPLRVTFTAVSADTTHSCGRTVADAVYCWGTQGSGLGDGLTTFKASPVLVAGGHPFASVSTGAFHSCAVTTAGAAYCWGAGGNNQIGNGSLNSQATPAPVAGGQTYTSLDAGWYHACATTGSSGRHCWGYNQSGQLGDGTKTDRSTPVTGSDGLTFTSVASARYHGCGVAGGAAYCWGSNSHGQLGDGTTVERLSATAVSGGLSFTQITAGGAANTGHSCALTSAGAAYCWGNNDFGQLGDGTTITRLTPTAVGGITFAALSAGSNHTCGVSASGVLYCWGNNASHQLGDGTSTMRMQPTVVSYTLPSYSAVSSGDSHTCAVGSIEAPPATGVVYCWGRNNEGQLGLGNVLSRENPTPINP